MNKMSMVGGEHCMRKGQQKILDKALLWGEAALNVLQDEAWTIKELNTWYHLLSNHCHENFSSKTVENLENGYFLAIVHHIIFIVKVYRCSNLLIFMKCF